MRKSLSSELRSAGLLSTEQYEFVQLFRSKNPSDSSVAPLMAVSRLSEHQIQNFILALTNTPKAPHNLAEVFARTELDSCPIEPRFLQHFEIIPLKWDEHNLEIATADPLHGNRLSQIRFLSGRKVKAVVATYSEIIRALKRKFPQFKPGRKIWENLPQQANPSSQKMSRQPKEAASGRSHPPASRPRPTPVSTEESRTAKAFGSQTTVPPPTREEPAVIEEIMPDMPLDASGPMDPIASSAIDMIDDGDMIAANDEGTMEPEIGAMEAEDAGSDISASASGLSDDMFDDADLAAALAEPDAAVPAGRSQDIEGEANDGPVGFELTAADPEQDETAATAPNDIGDGEMLDDMNALDGIEVDQLTDEAEISNGSGPAAPDEDSAFEMEGLSGELPDSHAPADDVGDDFDSMTEPAASSHEVTDEGLFDDIDLAAEDQPPHDPRLPASEETAKRQSASVSGSAPGLPADADIGLAQLVSRANLARTRLPIHGSADNINQILAEVAVLLKSPAVHLALASETTGARAIYSSLPELTQDSPTGLEIFDALNAHWTRLPVLQTLEESETFKDDVSGNVPLRWHACFCQVQDRQGAFISRLPETAGNAPFPEVCRRLVKRLLQVTEDL